MLNTLLLGGCWVLYLLHSWLILYLQFNFIIQFKMFGIGSVAQHVLSDGKLGEYLSVNFGWGLGVTFGVYWSYGISGEFSFLLSFAVILDI